MQKLQRSRKPLLAVKKAKSLRLDHASDNYLRYKLLMNVSMAISDSGSQRDGTCPELGMTTDVNSGCVVPIRSNVSGMSRSDNAPRIPSTGTWSKA